MSCQSRWRWSGAGVGVRGCSRPLTRLSTPLWYRQEGEKREQAFPNKPDGCTHACKQAAVCLFSFWHSWPRPFQNNANLTSSDYFPWSLRSPRNIMIAFPLQLGFPSRICAKRKRYFWNVKKKKKKYMWTWNGWVMISRVESVKDGGWCS